LYLFLYGRKTLPVILKEERRKNKVLRSIFEAKIEKVKRRWRKLHIEGPHNFRSLYNFFSVQYRQAEYVD